MSNKVNYNADAPNAYKAKFNEKINAFSDHPSYPWLRKYADDALAAHTSVGLMQIKAADFMDRINAAPLHIIRDWLDGKNMLEWELIRMEATA